MSEYTTFSDQLTESVAKVTDGKLHWKTNAEVAESTMMHQTSVDMDSRRVSVELLELQKKTHVEITRKKKHATQRKIANKKRLTVVQRSAKRSASKSPKKLTLQERIKIKLRQKAQSAKEKVKNKGEIAKAQQDLPPPSKSKPDESDEEDLDMNPDMKKNTSRKTKTISQRKPKYKQQPPVQSEAIKKFALKVRLPESFGVLICSPSGPCEKSGR